MVGDYQHQRLSKIGQRQAKWLHDTHRPGRVLIEMTPDGTFQHGHIDRAIRARGADFLTKMSNRGSGIPSPSQTGDGRHAGVVPSGYDTLIN